MLWNAQSSVMGDVKLLNVSLFVSPFLSRQQTFMNSETFLFKGFFDEIVLETVLILKSLQASIMKRSYVIPTTIIEHWN